MTTTVQQELEDYGDVLIACRIQQPLGKVFDTEDLMEITGQRGVHPGSKVIVIGEATRADWDARFARYGAGEMEDPWASSEFPFYYRVTAE